MATGEQLGELWIGVAAPVDVGAQGQDDRAAVAGQTREPGDERGTLGLVATRGERLFELVNGEQDAAAAGRERQRRARMLTGADENLLPVLAPGQHPAGERGEQARPQQRGIAGARGPDEPKKRGAGERCDDFREEPFAPAVVLAVSGVK